MAWQDYRLITPSSGALISEWQFAEGSGTTVDDAVGANNINLDLPTTPNYTWSARGISLALGLVQPPSITSARTVVMLYKMGIGETTGFILAGGSNPGFGALGDSISLSYTWHVGITRGVKPLEFRDATGAASYQLNRGGWCLLFVDYNGSYNTSLGFGGAIGGTTLRCTSFEVAWAAAYSGVLTAGERQQIYEMARVLSASRSFYLDWRDAPVTGDTVAIWGQSNAEGRSKLVDLSAPDAARTTPNTYICRRAETSYALMVKGTNQQTDAPTTDFGPELGMAWDYEDSVPLRDLYIAKYGIGNTFLTPTAGVDWSTSELETTGYVYLALKNLWTLEALMLNAGVGPCLRGMFWMQGENDATSDAASVLYMKELRQLVDKCREQVSDPQAKFCIGRIRDQDPTFDATAVVQVRLAHVMMGNLDNGTSWIDTDSFPLKTDLVHYNAVGMKSLGQAVYGQLLANPIVSADLPAVTDVRTGIDRGDGQVGTRTDATITSVLSTHSYGGGGTSLTGTYIEVAADDVRLATTFGPSSGLIGTLVVDYNDAGTVYPVVERSPADTKPLTFEWPVPDADIEGTVSKDNVAAVPVTGLIALLETDAAGIHWYTLEFNAADRPIAEGAARYVFDDGVYPPRMIPMRIAVAGGGGSGAGSGARTVTITVNDGATVLQNALVRMTEGANTFTALTNVSGIAVFNLDDATYTVSVTKSGYTYAGTTLLVNGAEVVTYSMTINVVTAPANPALSALEILCVDSTGTPEPAVDIDIRIVTVPSGDVNVAYRGLKQTSTSGLDGIASFEAVKLAVYEYKRGTAQVWERVTIGSGSTTNVSSFIGSP